MAGTEAKITYVLDRGFDDVAVWGTIWGQRHHWVCRVKHLERLVRRTEANGLCQTLSLAEAGRQLVEQGTLEAELRVRKRGQRQLKRQAVTAS